MYGEFGTPADMHKVVRTKPYPLPWVAENFVWKPSPPPPSCLASGAQPPPGGGGDGPAAEAASGATIAEELPTGAYYTMPATLAPFFPGSKTGAALPAAAQADWIAYFLDVSNAKKANNDAPPADLEFNSGGFMFEWRDEWWKANPVPTFHSVTGNADAVRAAALRGRRRRSVATPARRTWCSPAGGVTRNGLAPSARSPMAEGTTIRWSIQTPASSTAARTR